MKSIRRTPIALATLLAIASVIVIALSGAASAHSTGPGSGWFPGWRGTWLSPQKTGPGGSLSILRDSRPLISLALRHRTGLKLTLVQIEDLEILRDAFARRYRRERVELLDMREELRKSLREDNIDLADAGERIRAIEQKRAAGTFFTFHWVTPNDLYIG